MRSLSTHPFAVIACSAFLLTPAVTAQCGSADGHCHFSRWSSEGPAALDAFGTEVAMDGDLAAVAARGEARVYVFERQGSTWIPVDTLDDPHAGSNQFGDGLAVYGNRIAVGAPWDSTAAYQAGAVHVYERSPAGSYDLAETLYDATPTPEGDFGRSVAMTETWLTVGAPNDSWVGVVHTFLDLPGGWVLAETVTTLGVAGLGYKVAVHEVDAFQLILFATELDGDAVRHYRVSPGGVDTLTTLEPTAPGSFFGGSLAYDGQHLVIGDPHDDEAGPLSGAAYLYEVTSSDFQADLVHKLLPCDAQGGDRFGSSVGVDGNHVAIGAYRQGTPDHSGVVYTYAPGLFDHTWQVRDRVAPADGVFSGHFGVSLALQGLSLLVGSPTYDGAAESSGAAYMVSLAPNGALSGQCPCDVLGGSVPYGDGKPGSVGVPLLESNSIPIPGEVNVLRLSNALIGSAPLLLWGFAPTALPFDDGTLLVSDPILAALPVVGILGQVGVGWDVPLSPALCGADIYAQAFFFDPGAIGPYHTAQSNGLHLTLGY